MVETKGIKEVEGFVEDGVIEEDRQAEKIRKVIEESFLKDILKDEAITDVSFNGTTCYIQHNIEGRRKADYQPTKEEVLNLATRISQVQGTEITDTEPIMDTEIEGLRINSVHPAVSPSGATMAVRVSKPHMAVKDIATLADEHVRDLLDVIMKADLNLIISGQTGSGKTEVLKRLVGSIHDNRKITLLEDTMDSHLKQLYPNKDINSWRVLLSDSRKKKITFSDLIKAGLRNNPEWMIISEIRGGEEAYDFLQSALTGHSIITSIHANGAEAIPSRIRGMIGQVMDMNPILLGQDIVQNIRFGMHMEMVIGEDGKISRRIREIVEYEDFNERGLVSRNIYKIHKEYDEETGEYTEGSVVRPLSQKMLDIFKEKELYHLIPERFRKQIIKQEERGGKG